MTSLRVRASPKGWASFAFSETETRKARTIVRPCRIAPLFDIWWSGGAVHHRGHRGHRETLCVSQCPLCSLWLNQCATLRAGFGLILKNSEELPALLSERSIAAWRCATSTYSVFSD